MQTRRSFVYILMAAFLMSLPFESLYSFWIWSPKTKEWKNPKYSPLATPPLQLTAAMKLFEGEKYKEAIKEFRKVLVHYADSKEAPEARYYIGRCYEALHDTYAAFKEYQKAIETYPQSKRIKEMV